jgi:hypothetical protein
MRLTLRTLLAYLDNTLDPQDAEILKSKLAESGFATQMVQRIRDLLTRSDLSAPSPLARGPVEEANVICEYLDSTLPVEQVAEVERACLDSDPHLAEAAACHQILTMALENSANVTVGLRDRIYQLPSEQKRTADTGGSFSALEIPESVNSFDSPSSHVLSAEVPPPPDQEPVRPVGVGDSGVMAAPARFRQRELEDDRAAKAEPAIAGSRPINRHAESSIYGGQVRPSRITPWLVTLGLAGVLLYSLSQIFQPLLDSSEMANTANTNGQAVTAEENESQTPLEEVEADTATAKPASGSGSAGSDLGNAAGESPVPVVRDPASSDEGEEATKADAAKTDVSNGSEPENPKPEMDQPDPVVDDPEPPTTGSAPSTDADTESGNVGNDPASVVAPLIPQPPEAKETPPGDMEEKNSSDEKPESLSITAKVLSENTLLAVEKGGQWRRLGKDADIAAGQSLVVAPGFRATLALADSEITVVGPATAMLQPHDNGSLFVSLASGRLLVSSTKPESSVEIELGDEKCILELATPETSAAIQLSHTRKPSLDPLLAENHVPVRHVIALQGAVKVDFGGASQTLDSDSQWTQVGGGEPGVEALDSVPVWAVESTADGDALAATARNDLLALLDGASSLEITLRELLGFRRSEVAALAAQTLLGLGRSDVYFGGAGVFNDPKQRAYWSQHYDALLSRVDRGAEAAAEVQQAIKKMDAAAELQLFRMLTGYTDKELASGSDRQLLDNLESADMSVRVLAFENLRRITGVTFNYRAEQDSQGRREQYLKRWQVLQRKGEIRWKE